MDRRLERFFALRRAAAVSSSPASVELVDTLAAFVARGGKRIRPAMAAAGHAAVTRSGDVPAGVVTLGAALELLHGSLLVHDDWMDGDGTRRGGPTVHVTFATLHGDAQLGASLAILAGDLALGYAWSILLEAELDAAILAAVGRELAATQERVFFGQHLDVTGSPDLWRVHDLKTASYTARGPLRMGALVAGASADELDLLDRIGQAIGMAFQLRDDLLGTFGDAATTGKPIGNDLRAGKRTALLREADRLLAPRDRGPLDAVLGRRFATSDELERAVALLEACGARRNVEQRIAELHAEARALLDGCTLRTEELRGLADLVAQRER